MKKINHSSILTRFCPLLLSILFISAFLCFSSCKIGKVNYSDYISENRNNIFIASNESLSVKIYSVEKESPFIADGIKREVSARTEIYLSAPSGDKPCEISFSIRQQTYGGDMSFDNVKTEYFFSCTLDISKETTIPIKITYGEEITELSAQSVLSEEILAPLEALDKVITSEKELISSLTDKNGFSGEFYIRLIHEDNVYYYVSVITKNSKIYAFLLDGKSGKILARRES